MTKGKAYEGVCSTEIRRQGLDTCGRGDRGKELKITSGAEGDQKGWEKAQLTTVGRVGISSEDVSYLLGLGLGAMVNSKGRGP